LILRKIAKLQDNDAMPFFLSFMSGSIAGMVATMATFPLDVLRTRRSGTLEVHAANKSIVSYFSNTIKVEGIAGLFKGVTPTLYGAIPYEGIKFGTSNRAFYRLKVTLPFYPG
jgi:hypothetical protein